MALDPDSLHKPFRKLRKALKRFPKAPPPEDVHRLRTHTRRLEAMMHAFQFAQKRDGGRLLQAMTPVRKAAGEVRDMDVLVGFASSLPGASEDQSRVQLLEYLGSRRTKAAGKLRKTIVKRRKEARRFLKRCSARIQREVGASKNRACANSQMATDAMALSLHLAAELGAWPQLNAGNIHPYRLKVKELRYVLQFAQGEDVEFIDALGEVKDKIGEWHDWNELAAIADRVLNHGSADNITGQIRQRVKDELEKAIALTVAMRKRHLDSGLHQGGGQKPQPVHLNASVVETTARLAG